MVASSKGSKSDSASTASESHSLSRSFSFSLSLSVSVSVSVSLFLSLSLSPSVALCLSLFFSFSLSLSQGNPLKVLPVELSRLKKVRDLEMTTDNVTFPPPAISRSGTRKVLEFLPDCVFLCLSVCRRSGRSVGLYGWLSGCLSRRYR